MPPRPISRAETDMGVSPDDIAYYGSKILVRNRPDRPRYVVVFLIDPAFGTHRLDFAAHAKFAQLAPGASAEAQSLSTDEDPLAGRYRLITIWSDQPFDPDGPPSTFAGPAFSTSFAEYRNEPERIGALGGGAPALPGMAAFIAQFYSIVEYNADDRAKDSTRSMSAASGKPRIAAARP